MKIRPVGSEFFHSDGRTDRHDEGNSRFSQFCETPPKFVVPLKTNGFNAEIYPFLKKSCTSNTHVTVYNVKYNMV